MKKLIALLLVVTLAVSVSGCGLISDLYTQLIEKQKLPIPTGVTFPGVTETTQPSPERTQPTQPVQVDALTALRTQMEKELIAVADFGFPELSERYGIMDYLQDKYPWWLEENVFVQNMPQEQIVLTCEYGTPANLVCIVPASSDVTIRVNVGYPMDDEPYEKWSIAYQSENGEPILLLASDADGVTVTVDITDGKGKETTWFPYKGGTEPFPGDARSDGLVLDFAPVYEHNAYEAALNEGWFAPDAEAFQTYHYWRSDYRYLLELSYDPGEQYDGIVWLYDFYGMSEMVGEDFAVSYQGYWSYTNGVLHLEVEDYLFNKIKMDFLVLTDTEDASDIVIFCKDNCTGLPQFRENMKLDALSLYASDALSYYDYCLYQGWRAPEFGELMNTFWLSYLDYAMDLTDDSVPADNNGEVSIYDVDENGAYTLCYTGSWSYADCMLHLLLIPENNGQFVDDSFPVLMLDGQLLICRNDYGNGMPHFTADSMADILHQPRG